LFERNVWDAVLKFGAERVHWTQFEHLHKTPSHFQPPYAANEDEMSILSTARGLGMKEAMARLILTGRYALATEADESA
jgi:hypothetical protein